jgi:hypothetical protein
MKVLMDKEKTMAEIRVPTLGESVTEATIGRGSRRPATRRRRRAVGRARDRQGHHRGAAPGRRRARRDARQGRRDRRRRRAARHDRCRPGAVGGQARAAKPAPRRRPPRRPARRKAAVRRRRSEGAPAGGRAAAGGAQARPPRNRRRCLRRRGLRQGRPVTKGDVLAAIEPAGRVGARRGASRCRGPVAGHVRPSPATTPRAKSACA